MDKDEKKRSSFLLNWDAIKLDLRRYINHFVSNPDIIQEILQSTVVTLYEKYSGYTNEKVFKYRAFVVAKNKFHEHSRKTATHNLKEISLDVIGEGVYRFPEEDIAEKLSTDELKEKVRKIIDELPEFDHKLLAFRYFDELSYKEIAEILNKPEGTLRTYHWRIMNKIYKKLTEQNDQD
jgi:RNA polymerase sigma-70 factor (ECF subfamily)